MRFKTTNHELRCYTMNDVCAKDIRLEIFNERRIKNAPQNRNSEKRTTLKI